jgi:hypothetical protein
MTASLVDVGVDVSLFARLGRAATVARRCLARASSYDLRHDEQKANGPMTSSTEPLPQVQRFIAIARA